MMYDYLLALIPGIILWAFLFYRRPDLRHEMTVSSVICVPFGALDIFFIPAYWNPPRLFGLTPPLESFFFAFLVGGIASVLYEEVFGKTLVDNSAERRWEREELLLFGSISFILLHLTLNLGIMYVSLAIMLGSAILILHHRRDLIRESLIGGILFLSLYGVFLVVLKGFLMPGIFEWWNTEGLLDTRILDIPAGELLWAFLFGVMWSPLYEDLKGYGLADS